MPTIQLSTLFKPAVKPTTALKPASIAGAEKSVQPSSVDTWMNSLPPTSEMEPANGPAPGLPASTTAKPAAPHLLTRKSNPSPAAPKLPAADVGMFEPGMPVPLAATPKAGIIKQLWSLKRVKTAVAATVVPLLALAGYGLYAAIPHIAAVGATVAASAIAVPILIAVAATLGAVAIGYAGVKIYKGIKAAKAEKAAAKAAADRQANVDRVLNNQLLAATSPLPEPAMNKAANRPIPPPPPKHLVEQRIKTKMDAIIANTNGQASGIGEIPESENFF